MSQTTQKAIAASLKKLLIKKSLSKITINDIVLGYGLPLYYSGRRNIILLGCIKWIT